MILSGNSDAPLSSECLIVIFGSIISYYIIRLIFKIAQRNNPKYPIEQYRTPTDEYVELWTIGALGALFCASLMMTEPTLGAWVAFFVGIYAGAMAGFGQRSGVLMEMSGLAQENGQILFGTSALLLILMMLVGTFYFILLVKNVEDKMPYWISICMVTLIYFGWITTRSADMPYIFPWWWVICGTMLLINSLRTMDESGGDGVGMYITWGLWGALVGLMAGQGLTFWGGTTWYQFIGRDEKSLPTTFSQSDLIQLIREQVGWLGSRRGEESQPDTSKLESEINQMRWGIQFIIMVPLLLGTWWWLSS